MPQRKIVLIHGYSDVGTSFQAWGAQLRGAGADAREINICSYISLNNEVTIPDIAEGLARAMSDLKWDPEEEYDAVVHSTGMLVIRAFLLNNAKRPKKLKHLVALAPATWGSPLAHEGRSFVGSIFKGSHQIGPDFLNAGDLVLDGLELGSRFTWDLAHRDLLSANPIFTDSPESPYVAVFIGNTPYSGIRELVNQPGTDGTVRWAGCALDTRKYAVDLLRDTPDEARFGGGKWVNGRQRIPMFPVEGKTHGSLLSDPDPALVPLILDFLKVDSEASYLDWVGKAETQSAPALEKMKVAKDGTPIDGYQQFVFHVVDEYGNGVSDYVIDLFKADPTGLDRDALEQIDVNAFDLDVHAYQTDKSYRCFHVELRKGVIANGFGPLWLRLTASSGTDLIVYQGYGLTKEPLKEASPVALDLSPVAHELFYPFTTTLVEIRIHREPFPFQGQSKLLSMTTF
jgi:hypothetical protein